MCVDVGETSSSNCLCIMTEAEPSVFGHAVKVRKPYIITKQRECWTEKEHNKFLEALKQYGRAWRRIEEHIGSKSTVQIRSHAQKFFSKVARESSNNSRLRTDKSIEIPPPRPKRKPSHPYPRKVGHLSCKKGSFMDEQLWSFMPKQSVSGQEKKLPTSILTIFEPATVGTTSDTLKPSMSPVSSADNAVTVEKIFSEQRCGSKFSSTSVCKDNQLTDPPAVLSMQDTSSMVSDLDIQAPVSSKGASVATQQTTSLKLFGMTVIVSDLHHKEDLEHQESFSGSNNIDLETRKHQKQDEGGEINPFYGGIPQMSSCFPSHKNLTSPVEARMVALPSCWALYGGMFFDFSRPSITSLYQSQLQSTEDPSSKESCQTDPSNTSYNNSGNADRTSCESVVQLQESLPQPLVLKPSKNTVFSSLKPSSSSSCRGFMPYKKCVDGKELNSSPVARSERS